MHFLKDNVHSTAQHEKYIIIKGERSCIQITHETKCLALYNYFQIISVKHTL